MEVTAKVICFGTGWLPCNTETYFETFNNVQPLGKKYGIDWKCEKFSRGKSKRKSGNAPRTCFPKVWIKSNGLVLNTTNKHSSVLEQWPISKTFNNVHPPRNMELM